MAGPAGDQGRGGGLATEAGLLAADGALSNSEYNALLRLRQGLRDVLAARAAGREDADAAARLTKGLATAWSLPWIRPPSSS